MIPLQSENQAYSQISTETLVLRRSVGLSACSYHNGFCFKRALDYTNMLCDDGSVAHALTVRSGRALPTLELR